VFSINGYFVFVGVLYAVPVSTSLRNYGRKREAMDFLPTRWAYGLFANGSCAFEQILGDVEKYSACSLNCTSMSGYVPCVIGSRVIVVHKSIGRTLACVLRGASKSSITIGEYDLVHTPRCQPDLIYQ
jgi:hypothetical protein